jgi:hypothetical protein
MKLTFIQATNGTPLVKNRITNESYPKVSEVNSFDHTCDDIKTLYGLISVHADKSSALVVGNLDKTLKGESRAGHCVIAPTELLILDVDADLQYETRDEFLKAIGVNCSYVFQHSASSQSGDSLRGHYFLQLDNPTDTKAIKTWLKHLNFKHLSPTLSSNMQSLKWPLDIVVNDPGRIVYIAPPIQESDPISERIILVEKQNDYFSVPNVPTVRMSERINSLRAQKGLPSEPRIGNQRTIKINPDEVKITGVKYNGDFVYFNLNGGDSWGYYADADDPTIVSNFKGEPKFKLKDLDPKRYTEITSSRIEAIKQQIRIMVGELS